MKRLVLTTLACTVAIFLAVGLGCGGDDGEDEPEDIVVAKGTFKANIVSFGSNPEKNEPTVLVEVLNDETGEGTGVTATADDEGFVTFPDMTAGELVGFKCTKEKHKDTYQFHIQADAPDEKLWIVPDHIYNFAIVLAGLEVLDGKGTLAGAIYFVDADGEEIPVGGASVTSDPATEDIRYMDGDTGLPTTLDAQGCSHPAHDRFLVTNLEPGTATITATVGGVDVGSVLIPVVPDSIAIGNIYVTTDTNPGVDGCQ